MAAWLSWFCELMKCWLWVGIWRILEQTFHGSFDMQDLGDENYTPSMWYSKISQKDYSFDLEGVCHQGFATLQYGEGANSQSASNQHGILSFVQRRSTYRWSIPSSEMYLEARALSLSKCIQMIIQQISPRRGFQQIGLLPADKWWKLDRYMYFSFVHT